MQRNRRWDHTLNELNLADDIEDGCYARGILLMDLTHALSSSEICAGLLKYVRVS